MRISLPARLIMGALSAALLVAPATAQIDENITDRESADVLEELVVIGTRPGDKVRADPIYESILRQQMIEEVERMRRDEEENWRNSNLTYQSKRDSRMSWGYDPKADRDMRNSVDTNTLPGDTVKPASLFRAKF